MAIDTARLAGELAEARKMMGGKGDLWKIPEGETRVFVHGQIYPDDDHPATAGYNFVKVLMHYGVGGKKGGVVCLDAKANPIITHPVVQAFLSERKKGSFKIVKNQTCGVCDKMAAGELKTEEVERVTPKSAYLYGITPMFFRQDKTDDWTRLKFEPKMLMASVTVFNGLGSVTINNANAGIDITDPLSAVLAIIARKGTGFGDTSYEVQPDVETVRTPIKLDKGQRRILSEAMKEGGGCDLFRCIANLMKSPAVIKALMVGASIEEDEADDDRKSCFGLDFEPKDSECKICEERDACAEAVDGVQDGESDTPKRSGKTPHGRLVKAEEVEVEEGSEIEAEANESESESEGDGEAEAEPESESVEVPECFKTYEENTEDCDGCICKKECRVETLADLRAKAKLPAKASRPAIQTKASPKPPAKEDPEDEDDEDLAKIKEEARALSNKSRKR